MLADLQVHTPADKEHRYGDVGGPEPNQEFAQTLIRAHKAAGVEILAVTDHNRLDWWPALHAAGEESGVFVFPGIEINVNKCHLLALWDRTDEGFSLAQRFLDGLFDPGVSPIDSGRRPRPLSSGSVLDWARSARDCQGLVLAPHATAKRIGLFASNVCNVSSEVAQSGLVLAFDVFGSGGADVLINPAAEFGDLEPAWIISGDVRSLDEVGSRAVFLKVGAEPTLESLRQAFLMPHTRIRFPQPLKSEWSHVKHVTFLEAPQPSWPRIESIAIQGGFHDGLQLDFGPGLNAVIGGKGTGKSTLVEIIRYVMEAPESIAAASQAKDGLSNREKNFPANAEARIEYVARDSQVYTVTRVGNSTGSRLLRGGQLLEVDVRRRVQVRVFGQRELAALPQQQEALIAFVFDPAGESARKAEVQVSAAAAEVRRLSELLDRLDQSLATTQEAAEELRDLTDRLDQLANQGATALVEESAALGEAEIAVEALAVWPDSLMATANALRGASAAPQLPDHKLIPRDLVVLRDRASDAFVRAATDALGAAETLRDSLDKPLGAWRGHARQAREDLGARLADAGLSDAAELADGRKHIVYV
ncbi:MAG: AAA family ATPase [Solirubrobacteraceae bacterium]